MADNISLLFVPGAWHGPETWSSVITVIESRKMGYKCIAVELPSTTGDTSAGFGDDVKATQDRIEAEIRQGRNVILVVHSYGGQVGNSAVKGYTPTSPASSSGHVIGLAMMATGFTITGMSFLGGAGGKPPPQWTADTATGLATIVADARDMLYHDLPEEEGNSWVKRLRQQSLKALAEGGEFAYAGWKDVPCWFLVTLQDHALPAQVQKMFVEQAQAAGAAVTLREINSSHSPMISQPQETASFILEAASCLAETG
ncbi:hypothetical protein HIM_05150 [Hirsutella minnesotensis 3608]|uniref:AB hydrolase-1 domain-containing protein n=1 Tax=Hirsutella minnesotensis 3608 TaxID=1043627 RepID=A0A0F8A5J8_9HYPO|nr:hypothetical protein HIM_05150 [Hirsutella minnesotensis 3608]